MRFPIRPRFPDQSRCLDRDLTTQVRSAQRIECRQLYRSRDAAPRQAAPARSKERTPTALRFHRSSDNGIEKAAVDILRTSNVGPQAEVPPD
jgi:hypothetical protein